MDDNRYSLILDSYFRRIEKLYDKNPSYIVEGLENLIEEAEEDSYKEKSLIDKLFKDQDKELVLSIFLMILMAPFGLFTLNNIEALPLYFGGLIFFLAGLNVGFSQKGFGLIFLFSHGGTGMGMMIGSLLSKSFESGLFTDGGRNLVIYLVINILIVVIGFLSVVVYNLSDYIKNKKYIKSYILLIFIVGLAMAGIFPYIMKFIYNI